MVLCELCDFGSLQYRSKELLTSDQHTFLAYPTAKGALTQLYAGTSPEVTLAQSGAFFVPWARIDYPDREDLRDEVIKSKVIALIKEQVASKL